MTKSNITEYDNTAANNTDVEDVPLGENQMYPSNVNNAFREIMADLADVNDGTVTLTSPSFATATITGDLTVDTDTLHVDASSDKVSIGTTTGVRALTVNETSTSAIAHFESDQTESKVYFHDANTSQTYSVAIGSVGDDMAFYAASGGNERMRIDSSGNVLVSKTAANTSTVGVEARENGLIVGTRDGGQPLLLDRLTDDGDLTLFRKDSANVGSIFTYNGFLGIGSTSGNDAYLLMGSDFVAPATSTGTARDNAIDLGTSSRRFNDLYVGGNIYLGGTGSANALDDYEEGTWTPTTDQGTISASNSVYTKVGRMVRVQSLIQSFSNRTSSAALIIRGLPFTPASGQKSIGTVMHRYINAGGDHVVAYQSGSQSYFSFYACTTNGNYNGLNYSELSSSSSLFFVDLTYPAA